MTYVNISFGENRFTYETQKTGQAQSAGADNQTPNFNNTLATTIDKTLKVFGKTLSIHIETQNRVVSVLKRGVTTLSDGIQNIRDRKLPPEKQECIKALNDFDASLCKGLQNVKTDAIRKLLGETRAKLSSLQTKARDPKENINNVLESLKELREQLIGLSYLTKGTDGIWRKDSVSTNKNAVVAEQKSAPSAGSGSEIPGLAEHKSRPLPEIPPKHKDNTSGVKPTKVKQLVEQFNNRPVMGDRIPTGKTPLQEKQPFLVRLKGGIRHIFGKNPQGAKPALGGSKKQTKKISKEFKAKQPFETEKSAADRNFIKNIPKKVGEKFGEIKSSISEGFKSVGDAIAGRDALNNMVKLAENGNNPKSAATQSETPTVDVQPSGKTHIPPSTPPPLPPIPKEQASSNVAAPQSNPAGKRTPSYLTIGSDGKYYGNPVSKENKIKKDLLKAANTEGSIVDNMLNRAAGKSDNTAKNDALDFDQDWGE